MAGQKLQLPDDVGGFIVDGFNEPEADFDGMGVEDTTSGPVVAIRIGVGVVFRLGPGVSAGIVVTSTLGCAVRGGTLGGGVCGAGVMGTRGKKSIVVGPGVSEKSVGAIILVDVGISVTAIDVDSVGWRVGGATIDGMVAGAGRVTGVPAVGA